MACCSAHACRGLAKSKTAYLPLRSLVRQICVSSVVFSSDTPGDDSPPASSQLSESAASLRASLTTRGPRRKKVGEAVQERKFFSPEFEIPYGRRNKLKDFLERQDCYSRRKVIDVPEFYPGSILAVTVSDPYAPGKASRFVGICIERKNYGLGASFKLRNVIDEQGIEINYQIYSPLIKKIEVLKLEKRLDNNIQYLRDALPEYSTIDPEMTAIKHPPGKPVPVNDIKVKMKPRPWHRRWERFNLQGADLSDVLSPERLEEGKTWNVPQYKKMDLLNIYPMSSHSREDRSKVKQEFERHVEELKKKKKQRGS